MNSPKHHVCWIGRALTLSRPTPGPYTKREDRYPVTFGQVGFEELERRAWCAL